MENKSVKKCPQCKIRCTPRLKLNNSRIVLVDGAEELTRMFPDEDEFKLRMWSFMKPPRISQPTPLINPERLEQVREVLNQSEEQESDQTHITTQLSVEYLPDGSMVRTKSRTEIRTYPPVMRMDYVQSAADCSCCSGPGASSSPTQSTSR